MTPNQAKKIIKAELDRQGLPYTKVTARTISFSDLARMDALFVCIHGWTPDPAWHDLVDIAKENDFFLEAER